MSWVAMSLDGWKVVFGADDKTVIFWDTTTGEIECKLQGRTSDITSEAISNDGKNIVFGAVDQTANI